MVVNGFSLCRQLRSLIIFSTTMNKCSWGDPGGKITFNEKQIVEFCLKRRFGG